MNLLQKSEGILANYGSQELDEIQKQNEASEAKEPTEGGTESYT